MYQQTRIERCVDISWLWCLTNNSLQNYLGHSINAPTGRWQKNKDVHWYNRDKEQAEADRLEEIRKIKEAEAEALAAALFVSYHYFHSFINDKFCRGFAPTTKSANGLTGSSAAPLGTSSRQVKLTADDTQDAEKEEKKRKKQEKKEAKEAKKLKKEAKRAERHGSAGEGHKRHSRSRSPRRPRKDGDNDTRPRSRTPTGVSRHKYPTMDDLGGYDSDARERERERDRRRWNLNAQRDAPRRGRD